MSQIENYTPQQQEPRKDSFSESVIGKALTNSLSKVLTVALIILLLYALFYAWKQFNHGKDEIKIDETPVTIEDIRKIATLRTATCSEEVTVTKRKVNKYVNDPIDNGISKLFGIENGLITDRLCLIVKGSVSAGYDLTKLRDEDLYFTGDTVYLKMPQCQVFPVVSNYTDKEVFDSKGTWSEQEQEDAYDEAEDKIMLLALQKGLLRNAKESGEAQMKAWLQSFGFNTVYLLEYYQEIPRKNRPIPLPKAD